MTRVATTASVVEVAPALAEDERRARRADDQNDARAEARVLTQKRATVQQDAAALAAAWGDNDAGACDGDPSPDLLAARFHAALREVEAELAALQRRWIGSPPT